MLQYPVVPSFAVCFCLQEVVHHIEHTQVGCLFSGLAAQLQQGGVVVVVTRPQEVDYPLFRRAREVGCFPGFRERDALGGEAPLPVSP